VVERGAREEVDVCMADPGHDVALTVEATPRVLVDILYHDLAVQAALRQGAISLAGDRNFTRRFEALFDFGGPSTFTAPVPGVAGASR
jgi:hypothetical protein